MAKFSFSGDVTVKKLLKSLICNNAQKTVSYGGGFVTFTRLMTAFAVDFKTANYNKSFEIPAEDFFKLAPDDNERVSEVIERIY